MIDKKGWSAILLTAFINVRGVGGKKAALSMRITNDVVRGRKGSGARKMGPGRRGDASPGGSILFALTHLLTGGDDAVSLWRRLFTPNSALAEHRSVNRLCCGNCSHFDYLSVKFHKNKTDTTKGNLAYTVICQWNFIITRRIRLKRKLGLHFNLSVKFHNNKTDTTQKSSAIERQYDVWKNINMFQMNFFDTHFTTQEGGRHRVETPKQKLFNKLFRR